MKVLVTGATGFVGSHLVRHLASLSGYEVIAMDRASCDTSGIAPHAAEVLTFAEGQERAVLAEATDRARPEVIVHLAALLRVADEAAQVEELVRANVTFGTLVLQAAAEAGVRRFVNTGTFWDSMDDARTYRPVDLYAATKRAFEDILRYYADAHGIRAVTLKLFGVYGPDDPRRNVFSYFEDSIGAAEPVAFSPGEQVLDLVHVDDVVRAYECAVRYLAGRDGAEVETFEIGSGEGLTLRQVADVYAQCRGRPLGIAWGGRPYRPREVFHRTADLSAARKALGWQPRYDMRTGIARLVEQVYGRRGR